MAEHESADAHLASLSAAQGSLERNIQARLERLGTSLGRPAAAHLDALARHTGLDKRIQSVADLLARSRRTIELDLALRERELNAQTAASTADVRSVVVLFAVATVVLNLVALVIDVGGLPKPDGSRFPRLATVISVSMLASLGAAVLSIAVLLAAKGSPRPHQARLMRLVAGMLAAVGSAGLVWVLSEPSSWVVAASVLCVIASSLVLAWALRLDGRAASEVGGR